MRIMSTRPRRGVVSILAAMVMIAGVIGAGTVSSGAWFTSAKATTGSITGALLSIGEIGKTSDQKTISVADVYPMTDAQAATGAKSEWITVRNTGTIPLDWTMSIVNPRAVAPLTEAQLANFRFQLFGESGSALTDALSLGSMPLVASPGVFQTRGTTLAAGAQSKAQIKVWLSTTSQNEFQGAKASFDVVINGMQNGTGGVLSPISLTAAKSGTPSGTSTALSWTDVRASLSASGVAGTPTYSVERSATADFATSQVVYTGTATTAADLSDSALVDRSAVQTVGAMSFSAISAGTTSNGPSLSRELSVCGISEGELYCWGGAAYPNPTRMATGSIGSRSLKDVSVGYNILCVIAVDNTVHCKGSNGYVANGDFVQVSLSGVREVSKIVNFGISSGLCAVGDGQLYCWGLTAPAGAQGVTPKAVRDSSGALIDRVTDIRAGTSGNACVLRDATSGTEVWCWHSGGRSSSTDAGPSFAGRGQAAERVEYPAKVTALPSGPITGLYVEQQTACVIIAPNLHCWGAAVGGVGSPFLRWTPTTLDISTWASGFDRIRATDQIAAIYGGHLCLERGGDVYCGSHAGPSAGVEKVVSLGGAGAKLSSGAGWTLCASRADGLTYCGARWSAYRDVWGNGATGLSQDAATDAARNAPVGVKSPARNFEIGAVGCSAGAQMRDGACTLSPTSGYHYRVRFTVSGGDGQPSAWVVAARS